MDTAGFVIRDPVLRLLRSQRALPDPTLIAIWMILTGVVLALRPALDGEPAMLQLLALSAAGACAYFTVMALVARRHLVVARGFIRSLVASRAA